MMNRDGSQEGEARRPEARIRAFSDLARLLPGPLPARQRVAGWQRLRQARGSGQPMAHRDLYRGGSGSWTASLSPARMAWVMAAAIAIPVVVWRVARPGEPRAMEYVVSGEDLGEGPTAKTGAATGATGRVLSSRTGHAELLFTDGSRIGLHRAARVTVAELTARGAHVRVLDGVVEVDVRHRPDTAWAFDAGPYTARVKGTSFELGWDAADRRLTLKMHGGVVALVKPDGGPELLVKGGESVFLDDDGPSSTTAPPAASGGGERAPDALASGSAPAISGGAPAARWGVDRSEQAGERPPVARARPAHPRWAPLLARGDFETIVAQAAKTGLELCLGSDTEQNLAALADAARYTHRDDLARRVLLTLRARFPATSRARDAAFFLARLGETGGSGALPWYARYLEEAPRGSYAEEALGREMILLGRRREDAARARGVASHYLEAYPRGLYTSEASALLASPAAP
jgi:hypothetical protein